MSALLEVRNLTVRFPLRGGIWRRTIGLIPAVDGVSFDIEPGEVLGLVGESGCGKTTLGRAVCNLLAPMHPDVKLGGDVRLHADLPSVDLNGLGHRRMLPYRARMQMIFQDPASSLNPSLSVGRIIEGPLRIHDDLTRNERRRRVAALLDRVGLPPESAERYPHEFSGGQQQRLGIARALATKPRLIVADEPVSALDVSIRAQILNLMAGLARDLELAYLFITHDLSVVQYIADRIAVMYLGRFVELGTAGDVADTPRHPYTRALWASAPRPTVGDRGSARPLLAGDVPAPHQRPSGCAFRSRCPIARADCARSDPELRPISPSHVVACPHSEPDG